jgi:hypothetical protein
MHALPCARAGPGPTSCSRGNQQVVPGRGAGAAVGGGRGQSTRRKSMPGNSSPPLRQESCSLMLAGWPHIGGYSPTAGSNVVRATQTDGVAPQWERLPVERRQRGARSHRAERVAPQGRQTAPVAWQQRKGACTRTEAEPPRGKPMRGRSAVERRPPAKGNLPANGRARSVWGTGGLLSRGDRARRAVRTADIGGRTGSQRSRGEPKGPRDATLQSRGPGRCLWGREDARSTSRDSGGSRTVDADECRL